MLSARVMVTAEELDQVLALKSFQRVFAELMVLLYIAGVAAVAHASGAYYVLFPELGALSYDVLIRPSGRWSNAPVHLVVTPVLTAVAGILITRTFPYGFTAALLCVGSAIAIMRGLRSPIVPAVSAGLLPLVLGIKSWWYPPGILLGTAFLGTLSIPWRRLHQVGRYQHVVRRDKGRYMAESWSSVGGYRCLWVLAFVVLAMGLVEFTGERFVLFPPLVVIAYEMFVRPDSRLRRPRILGLPIVCVLAAAGGLICHHLMGVGPWAAVWSMVIGMIVLRVSRLHFPPILAIALLPQVMNHPTVVYPFAVLSGTLLLSVWFLLYGWLVQQEKPELP